MSGTFKQEQERAFAARSAIRVMSTGGQVYGIGMTVTDPWDGKMSKVADVGREGPNLHQWQINLESGSVVNVEAKCYRVLDYEEKTDG